MATQPAAGTEQHDSNTPVETRTGRTAAASGLLLRLCLGASILLVLSGAILYLSWDLMPARVQYIPRYVRAHLLPQKPPPEAVATPASAVAPEQALTRLKLAVSESDVPTGDEEVPARSDEESAVTTADPGEPGEDNAASAAPTATPTTAPAPTAEPLHVQPGPTARLDNVRHEYQGWNNCGPATLAMNLSYFGRPETQEETAPFLKPDPDDKNVSPDEMAAYAHKIGLGAKVVVGMDLQMLRTFVANGIPVTVESWFIPEPDDEMGHYLLLVGYEGDNLTFYDSYKGPNVVKDAATFDQLWKVFNRTAIIVWTPEQEALVRSILGQLDDPQVMYRQALATAHEAVEANPQDKFAWFNLGSNLTALGRYQDAVQAFDTARSLQLPWRMLWYQFGPYEAYYQNRQYEEVIQLATATLGGADNLEESYYWRGRAHAALGQVDEARRDLEQALELNPNFAPAEKALASLP